MQKFCALIFIFNFTIFMYSVAISNKIIMLVTAINFIVALFGGLFALLIDLKKHDYRT